MQRADFVEWIGGAKERLIERAVELEVWGNDEGHFGLGKRLLNEVDQKISELQKNVHLYAERNNREHVIPLQVSGHVLVYRVVFENDICGIEILDVRRSY